MTCFHSGFIGSRVIKKANVETADSSIDGGSRQQFIKQFASCCLQSFCDLLKHALQIFNSHPPVEVAFLPQGGFELFLQPFPLTNLQSLPMTELGEYCLSTSLMSIKLRHCNHRLSGSNQHVLNIIKLKC